MYSQAAWLISIGRIPYKDFFLAQPPFWFFLTSIFINLLGSSIFSIRIVSVISSILLIGLIYFLCRNIFGKIESIAASVIYAIHPYIVFWGKIGILEPLASLFLFTGVMIFLSNVNFSSRKMLLSGALIGVAFLTKYSILFFIVGAFPILLYSVLRKVSMIELLKCIGCIALGMVIVIIPFICYLCYVNAYYEFYLDTYVAQRLMFRFPEWVSLGFWGEFFVNLKFEIFLLIVYPLVFILARKIGFRSICISQLDEIALFSG
ncbi:MAG: glycosyltransferase family 39 protein, partial [Candidatus Bathyarchaeia archaeon]